MAKAKKSVVIRRELWLKKGQQIIVTSQPKASQIAKPYFAKWLESCQELPADMWHTAARHKKACRERPLLANDNNGYLDKRQPCICGAEEKALVKIADMHPAMLANTIKWVLRLVGQEIASPFAHYGVTKAQLLAAVPQWNTLLNEAKNKQLEMAGVGWDAQWWRECKAAITWHNLEIK
jgi:hypothetical protein